MILSYRLTEMKQYQFGTSMPFRWERSMPSLYGLFIHYFYDPLGLTATPPTSQGSCQVSDGGVAFFDFRFAPALCSFHVSEKSDSSCCDRQQRNA